MANLGGLPACCTLACRFGKASSPELFVLPLPQDSSRAQHKDRPSPSARSPRPRPPSCSLRCAGRQQGRVTDCRCLPSIVTWYVVSSADRIHLGIFSICDARWGLIRSCTGGAKNLFGIVVAACPLAPQQYVWSLHRSAGLQGCRACATWRPSPGILQCCCVHSGFCSCCPTAQLLRFCMARRDISHQVMGMPQNM